MRRFYRISSPSLSPLSSSNTRKTLNPNSFIILTKCLSDPFGRNFCSDTDARPTPSIWPQLSSLLLDKLAHTPASTIPTRDADLVERVSILKAELLAIGDDKERLDRVLDEKGTWLYRCYPNGVVELMDQLEPHAHLALQVFNWRRKEENCRVPLTPEEYAKGIKFAGRARNMKLAVTIFNEAANRHVSKTSVYNALMGAYMCNGLADKCLSLFRDFEKQRRCAPSVVTYNILILVYAQPLLVKDMEAAFAEIRKLNLSPTLKTYNNLIAGYITARNWEKMEATFQLMVSGPIKPDISTHELMLRGYANSGNLLQMEKIYELIKDQIDKSRTSLIRAMICAYCRSVDKDRVKKVENLLRLISEEKYMPWFNVLLIRLYAQEDILEAMEDSINKAFEHNTSVNTNHVMRAIAGSYFRYNAVDNLANFVRRAESAHWRISRSLYHSMMMMYGSQKRFQDMEGVLRDMAKFNFSFVRRTFYIMYKAYVTHGMEFKANRVVGMMLKYGFLPPLLSDDARLASVGPEIA